MCCARLPLGRLDCLAGGRESQGLLAGAGFAVLRSYDYTHADICRPALAEGPALGLRELDKHLAALAPSHRELGRAELASPWLAAARARQVPGPAHVAVPPASMTTVPSARLNAKGFRSETPELGTTAATRLLLAVGRIEE